MAVSNLSIPNFDKLALRKGTHISTLWGIEYCGDNEGTAMRIRDSLSFPNVTAAHAFLQSYNHRNKPVFALIEFWTEDESVILLAAEAVALYSGLDLVLV